MIKKIKKVKNSKDYKYIPEGDLRKICIPVSSIIPLENNPRHNEKTVKELVKVVKDIGFRRPIILNENYEIKAGNTAYKAALKLKMPFIPAVRTSFESESDEWKCVLSDNKIGEKSEWNLEVLRKLIDSGKILPETRNTGFTEKELLSIHELKEKSSCGLSGASNVNSKNRMLGKLLNNLIKYEITKDDSDFGYIGMDDKNKIISAYKVEENDEKMVVFYQKTKKKSIKKVKKSKKKIKK